MNAFAIKTEGLADTECAILEVYQHSGICFIELPPHADPWAVPLLISSFAQRAEVTIDAQWSERWVASRVVPPDRQNLGEILRVNELDSYDPLRIIQQTEGRCAQDDYYLAPLSNIPSWLTERQTKRLADAFTLDNYRILCAFRDGKTRLVESTELFNNDKRFNRIRSDKNIFHRMTLQAGGHGISWGDARFIPCSTLYTAGTELALLAQDIPHLASQALVDSAEAAQMLNCSRQNISSLAARGKLTPAKTSPKTSLFYRSDILARAE